jgi:hypothetical protein
MIQQDASSSAEFREYWAGQRVFALVLGRRANPASPPAFETGGLKY